MKEELTRLICQSAEDARLSWSDQVILTEETSVTLHEVEEPALAQGILLVRYQRNVNAICIEYQYH